MIKVVFFGTGPVAAASLDSIRHLFHIEAVITKSTPAHHKHVAPVEALAKTHNFPLLFANTRRELDDILSKQNFKSQVGIIVDYGVIVSKVVIDSFEYGIINSHFSLLPQWRGADPITFSLLSGQQKTGVSLMIIEPTLDTGKLITQKTISIEQEDTIESLTKKLISLSNNLISEYVPRYLNNQIKPRNQPHPERATYSSKLSKKDGVIDWNKTADAIEREVRAYKGWPQSHTTLGSIDVVITKASVVRGQDATPGTLKIEKNRLLIAASKDWLEIHTLKPSGKKEMPVSAFLAGYRSKIIN